MLLRTKNEYAVYEPLIKNFKMKRNNAYHTMNRIITPSIYSINQ